MSEIYLDGIEVYAFHGYYPEEQRIGGKYRIDVKMVTDTSKAEKNDSLQDTVNYEKVFELVKEEMKEQSKLMEHIAHRIVKRIFSDFPQLELVRVKISKLHPPLDGILDKVSIALEKRREEMI